MGLRLGSLRGELWRRILPSKVVLDAVMSKNVGCIVSRSYEQNGGQEWVYVFEDHHVR